MLLSINNELLWGCATLDACFISKEGIKCPISKLLIGLYSCKIGELIESPDIQEMYISIPASVMEIRWVAVNM